MCEGRVRATVGRKDGTLTASRDSRPHCPRNASPTPQTGAQPITSLPPTTTKERAITTASDREELSKRPAITRQDTLPEAARKTLRFHFSRMLRHESGTIDGTDIEELHDMRVAVRRLRAAVQLFRPYLPKKQAALLRKDLRRLGRALGPARDCDVMLANLASYRAGLPAPAQAALAPLVRQWRKQRNRARREMLNFLASKRYRQLKERIGLLLEPSGPLQAVSDKKNGQPAHSVPLVAAETPLLLTRRYEQLLTYGPSLHGASIETLHALRIDCKRLRYALEFLRETLPPQAHAAIEDLKQAQDHLGDLHDAYVAGRVLRKLMQKWQDGQEESLVPPAARAALGEYLGYCDELARANAHTFPAIWERLTGQDFSRRLHEIMSPAPLSPLAPPRTRAEKERT